MLVTIALIHVLNNGTPVEKKTFKGKESEIQVLMKKCEKKENENTFCFIKQERNKTETVYTYLPTMQQFVLKNKQK